MKYFCTHTRFSTTVILHKTVFMFQDMLRDEGREINHHGRVRKFDADGNEIEEGEEDEVRK